MKMGYSQFLILLNVLVLVAGQHGAEKGSTDVTVRNGERFWFGHFICWIHDELSTVKFNLYKNGTLVTTAEANDEGTIFKDLLDPKKEVVFLIHGYENGCDKEFILTTRQAYAEAKPDVQVVTVCYTSAEHSMWTFGYARKTLRCVAEHVKTVLKRVNAEAKVKWENITVIGHSFGTQVAGATGNMLGGKLVRLIALDPPSGTFSFLFAELTPHSAKNVIAVHTSGYPLGSYWNVGTADFYVNNGKQQPGCTTIDLMCSHRRSFRIFLNVIRNAKTYKALQCPNFDDLINGRCAENPTTYLNTSVTAKGTFYFQTEGVKPWKQINVPK